MRRRNSLETEQKIIAKCSIWYPIYEMIFRKKYISRQIAHCIFIAYCCTLTRGNENYRCFNGFAIKAFQLFWQIKKIIHFRQQCAMKTDSFMQKYAMANNYTHHYTSYNYNLFWFHICTSLYVCINTLTSAIELEH